MYFVVVQFLRFVINTKIQQDSYVATVCTLSSPGHNESTFTILYIFAFG